MLFNQSLGSNDKACVKVSTVLGDCAPAGHSLFETQCATLGSWHHMQWLQDSIMAVLGPETWDLGLRQVVGVCGNPVEAPVAR